MANLTKDNPQRISRDLTIAQDRLSGMTYRQIAKRHNLSPRHIGEILNDDEIKDILETGTKQIVALLPKAIDNYSGFLTSENEKIRLEASRDVQKTTGIMPTHTVNQFFTNILNQQNNILITEEMQEFCKWRSERDNRVYDIPHVQKHEAPDTDDL